VVIRTEIHLNPESSMIDSIEMFDLETSNRLGEFNFVYEEIDDLDELMDVPNGYERIELSEWTGNFE
ncbi:MAG: hypothetical protein U9Q67_04230, partial [Patescibacteria group bacterium]|nr:hypothetical protein [Patescibacteria group bacterium]